MRPYTSVGQYLPCPLHFRAHQPIVHLCLQANCEHPLLCPKCLSTHPQTHLRVSLEEFAYQVENLRWDQMVSQATGMANRSKAGCFNALNKIRSQITRFLDHVEEEIVGWRDREESRIGELKNRQESIQLQSFSINYSNQFQHVLQYVNEQCRKFRLKKDLRKQIVNQLSSFKNKSQNYERNLLQSIPQIMRSLKQLNNLFNNSLLTSRLHMPEFQLQWDYLRKHQDIQINGSQITRVHSTVRWGQLWSAGCLANSDMDSNGSRPYLWSIKIKEVKTWVGIGICYLSSVESNYYQGRQWKAVGLGHGHYLVSSSGYVSSHTDAKVNAKIKGFRFWSGDVLKFRYSPQSGKLKALKVNSTESFEMEVKKEGMYVVCVYLLNTGDRVQIVHNS